MHGYGWTAVPRSLNNLIRELGVQSTGAPLEMKDFVRPNTPLARQIVKYAEVHLPTQTLNHSMRVFFYGTTLKLSDWKSPGLH